jgi:hypothetical protein
LTLTALPVELFSFPASQPFFAFFFRHFGHFGHAFASSRVLLLIEPALGGFAHTLAGCGVLDVGRVEANDLVLALAGAGGAVPILEFTAFGLLLADALASRVARPFMEFAFAFADTVALATTGFEVEVRPEVLRAIVWVFARVDDFVFGNHWNWLNKGKFTAISGSTAKTANKSNANVSILMYNFEIMNKDYLSGIYCYLFKM